MTGCSLATAFREASDQDAAAVAELHAASWRTHYRGSARDSYLDGPIGAERLAFWNRRLSVPNPRRVVVLAQIGPRLAGFVCAIAGADARWGTLVDNLHVAADNKGRGLGRALMREAASRLPATAAAEPLHLFVLAANVAARGFYDRMGGEIVGEEHHSLPDGTEHPVIRYAWASPRQLIRIATGDVP